MTPELDHPYKTLENTPLWLAVEKAVADLESNKDLKLTTRLEYVVGYLCDQLVQSGVSFSLDSDRTGRL